MPDAPRQAVILLSGASIEPGFGATPMPEAGLVRKGIRARFPQCFGQQKSIARKMLLAPIELPTPTLRRLFCRDAQDSFGMTTPNVGGRATLAVAIGTHDREFLGDREQSVAKLVLDGEPCL
jgi:hypothetical protein